MSDEKPPWARRLRKLRKARRWTQRGVAMRVVAQLQRNGRYTRTLESVTTQVKRWERGVVVPDEAHQYCLATAFGVSVPELFGDHARLSALPGRYAATSGNLELPHFSHAEENPMQRRLFVAWLMRLSAGAAVIPEPLKQLLGLLDDDPDILPAITMNDVTKLDAVHTTLNQLSMDVGALSRRAAVGQLSHATSQLRARVPGSPGSEAPSVRSAAAALSAR